MENFEAFSDEFGAHFYAGLWDVCTVPLVNGETWRDYLAACAGL